MDEKIRGKVLDLGLIDLYEQAAAQSARARLGLAQAAPADECIPELIDVLVTFTGDIAELKALGLRGGSGVRTPDGLHILEGRLDPTLLGQLAAIPHVVSVRRVPEAHPELNYSLIDMRAIALRAAFPGLDGAGVVIGVIDKGFDWRHGSFTKFETQPDNTQVEKSRFLAIWDQLPLTPLDPSNPTPPHETPGPGGLGVVYTQADLNAGLTPGGPKPRTRDEKDGHGTHVAGIAAGDGSPASCCRGGGVYVGVAPKADIVGVRLTGSAHFIEALNFVKAQAGTRPLVINLSMSFPGAAAHDGTHPTEKALDAFITSNPNCAVVVAAGNHAAEERHIREVVPKSGTKDIEFTVHEGDAATIRELDFWYSSGHQVHLKLTTPGGGVTEVVRHGAAERRFFLEDRALGIPQAPTNLIGAAGDAQVVLSWDAVAGATSYEVHRDEGCTGTPLLIATPTGTAYTDTGLNNGKSYCYVVKARNGAGPSLASNQVGFTPTAPAPSAPLHLLAFPGNAQVVLGWAASAGATSYEILRDEGCTGSLTSLATQAATAFTDTGLTNGTSYCYVVKAKSGAGTSPASDRVRATPDEATAAPQAPAGLRGTAGDAQVVLSWGASAAATAYEVLRDEGCTGSPTSIATPTGTTFTDTGLTNGKSYCYVVKARNGAGAGPSSNQVSVTPVSPAPPAPANVFTIADNAKISLGWDPSPGATGYLIQRATAPGGPYVQAGTSTVSNFTDTGRLNGTTYYYVVRATNAAGTSLPSAEKSATPASGGEMRVTVDMRASHPDNNEPNCWIQLLKPKNDKIFPGKWKLTFSNPSATDDVELHGWIPHHDKSGQTVRPPQFVAATTDTTISIPATAHRAITIANYVGRTNALDCGSSGSINESSGRGPVRKGAAANPKPDLAAPGTGITSANAGATILKGEACDCCPEFLLPLYTDKTGTSMAAPHVAGAVALMLQEDPTLTQAKVVEFLKKNIAPPPGEDANAWGGGLLDVTKAIAAVKLAKAGGTPVAASSPSTVSTPEAGAQRAMSTPAHVLGEALRAQARMIPDGELCAALVSRHFSEARRLVNTNTRVATMWHRGDGPRLLRRLVVGALDPAAPAPILSQEQREYLERLFEQLQRYGSPSLKASIDRHGAKLIQLLERPLAAQMVSQSAQVNA